MAKDFIDEIIVVKESACYPLHHVKTQIPYDIVSSSLHTENILFLILLTFQEICDKYIWV